MLCLLEMLFGGTSQIIDIAKWLGVTFAERRSSSSVTLVNTTDDVESCPSAERSAVTSGERYARKKSVAFEKLTG